MADTVSKASEGIPRTASLRWTLNLWLLAAFGIGFAVLALFGWHAASTRAERDAEAQARAAMRGVLATIDYNEAQITPLLSGLSAHQFLPESVPFYAAARQFERQAAAVPGTRLRQTALNPTNPADRPTAREHPLVERFVRDPAAKEFAATEGDSFVFALPTRVSDQGCLSCHGDPRAAPPSMVDVFGTANGFGWRLGEVVGAEIVTVPTGPALAAARGALGRLLLVVALVFVLLLAAVNLVLHRLVVARLRRVAAAAEAVSLGDPGVPSFAEERGDEIGGLAAAFERMRRSLVTAMAMLDG